MIPVTANDVFLPRRAERRREVVRLLLLLAVMLASAPLVAHAADRPKKAAGAPAKPAATPAKSADAGHAASSPMAAPSASHPSFSVDMVMTHEGETFKMKRTVDHGKTRMDMSGGGMEAVQIMLDDPQRTMYMLMPKEKQGMKQSLAAAEKMASQHAKGGEERPQPAAEPSTKIEKLGQEKIDGRTADKYRISYEQGSGLMWIDAERQLPLRMEAEGSTVEFKDYDFGPQPAELFQPPKGYEIMDMDEMMAKMPQGAMGGMAGMAGGMGGMAGGMVKGMAGNMAGGVGGTMGGALGGVLGGPIGSMIGQYVGQKIGARIGVAAAGVVLPGK
jgi:uncharacterized protein DUF4412